MRNQLERLEQSQNAKAIQIENARGPLLSESIAFVPNSKRFNPNFAGSNLLMAVALSMAVMTSMGARTANAKEMNNPLSRAAVDLAPDVRAELDKEFPAQIDFTLKAIDKGTDVEGKFYKVSGKDNNKEFYLYKATSNQKIQKDPTGYARNTEVVAKFNLLKDATGQEVWVRQDLNQATAVIKGNLEAGNCKDKCPDAVVIVAEVDENAALIQGAEIDPINIYDLTPYVLCDRWGNWYDNAPTVVIPTPTVPSVKPTPVPVISCPPGTVKSAQSTEGMMVCLPVPGSNSGTGDGSTPLSPNPNIPRMPGH